MGYRYTLLLLTPKHIIMHVGRRHSPGFTILLASAALRVYNGTFGEGIVLAGGEGTGGSYVEVWLGSESVAGKDVRQ